MSESLRRVRENAEYIGVIRDLTRERLCELRSDLIQSSDRLDDKYACLTLRAVATHLGADEVSTRLYGISANRTGGRRKRAFHSQRAFASSFVDVDRDGKGTIVERVSIEQRTVQVLTSVWVDFAIISPQNAQGLEKSRSLEMMTHVSSSFTRLTRSAAPNGYAVDGAYLHSMFGAASESITPSDMFSPTTPPSKSWLQHPLSTMRLFYREGGAHDYNSVQRSVWNFPYGAQINGQNHKESGDSHKYSACV